MAKPNTTRRAVLAAATVLATGACAAPAQVPETPTETATETSLPEPVDAPTAAPAPQPAGRAALTGMETFDETVAEAWSQRRVIAIKVENTAAARPQTGIGHADIVFEQLTEGGVTRYLALYHSDLPPLVGNVRSARLIDADLLAGFPSAVLVASGARRDVVDHLADADVSVLWHGAADGLFRVSYKRPPHNVFAEPVALADQARDLAPATPPTGWVFSPRPPEGGVAVDDEFVVAVSPAARSGWRYDVQRSRWSKTHNGEPHTTVGAEPIAPANVVVLEAESVTRGEHKDSAGNPTTVTDIVGGGRATILRDGQRHDARWSKPTASSPIAFTTSDGRPFPLRPGPTWVHLVAPDTTS